MPQNAHVAPRCNDCDGFPVVAITTGTRTPDGHRATLLVTCRACDGTGVHTAPAARLARAAR